MAIVTHRKLPAATRRRRGSTSKAATPRADRSPFFPLGVQGGCSAGGALSFRWGHEVVCGHEVWAQGVGAQGVGAQGVWARGVWARGVWARGVGTRCGHGVEKPELLPGGHSAVTLQQRTLSRGGQGGTRGRGRGLLTPSPRRAGRASSLTSQAAHAADPRRVCRSSRF